MNRRAGRSGIGRMARLGAAASLAACGAALAGGTPENVLLIVDPGSRDAMHIANHYRMARLVPDANIVYMFPGAAGYGEFVGVNQAAVLGEIERRGLGGHIDYIVIAGGPAFFVPAPGLVSDVCFPVSRFSIGTAYGLAFVSERVLAGTTSSLTNGYVGLTDEAIAFDSDTAYWLGSPSNDPLASRYFIGAMLGYTGANGNSVDEIIAMIDRSVAADGTRPAGTFCFMDNQADAARNVRASQNQYPAVVASLTALGSGAQVLSGALPTGRHDVLGVVTGFASADVAGGDFTILPGAFADHLTSWAATFDNASQTKVSAWIAKGASGSAGMVEEPCNNTAKFPHSRLHVFHRKGLSLGEAWLRSVIFTPFQMLFYGDPLTRAHAYIPVVEVPDAPAGKVSGTIVLTPQASTGNPAAAIESLELLIDGVSRGVASPGEAFALDTTSLGDGAHDVRVLAYDTTGVRSTGRWAGSMVVDNAGMSVRAVPSATAGDLSTLFEFTIESSAAGEVQLWHNGRVVAAGAAPGTLGVRGQTLGAGRVEVRAGVMVSGGRVVMSEPIELDIEPAGAPTGTPPVAFGYTKPLTPGAVSVVELPATFDDDPALASFEIASGPAQATILGTTTRGYRVLRAAPDARGSDTMSFRVSTPSGLSAAVTVRLDYGGCLADCNGDGALNIFDFLCFQGKVTTGDPAADCNGDGSVNIFDFLCFQGLVTGGCD